MLYGFPGPSITYCDDITTHITVDDEKEAVKFMQPRLNRMEEWARRWKFSFAADKCMAMAFTRRSKPPPNPVFFISGQIIPFVTETKFFGLIFDYKLTWKPHIDYVVDRVNKCKNIFTILSKHKFGPKISTLITLFKAVVLSRVDYGIIIFGGAAPSNLKHIDVALRSIMRSILGAFKSTPTEVLYSELGLEPVALRRVALAERYIIELGHKPCNAAYSLGYNLFHGMPTFKKWGVPCLNSFIVDLRERGFNIFSEPPDTMPRFPPYSPWSDPPFEAKFFSLSKGKAKENPALVKGLFASICAALPQTALSVYTDGSLLPESNSTAGAFFIPSLQFDSSFHMVRNTSVFSAELIAIKEALNYVYSLDSFHDEVRVFTDSESSIKSLLSAAGKHPIVAEILRIMNCLKSTGVKTTLAWIPSHTGIPGNEKADALALAECKNRSRLVKNRLSPPEQISLASAEWRERRRIQLRVCQKPSVQLMSQPSLIPWFFHKKRFISTILHRLRTGHNRLNAFRHKFDDTIDPLCRFCHNELEKFEHFLTNCQHFRYKITKLKSFCRLHNLHLNSLTVLGLDPEIDSHLQYSLRKLLIKLIKSSELIFII